MFQGTSQPVEFGDNELIAGPVGRMQRLVKLRAPCELATGLVQEHPVATDGQQSIVLGFRVLVAGRHP